MVSSFCRREVVRLRRRFGWSSSIEDDDSDSSCATFSPSFGEQKTNAAAIDAKEDATIVDDQAGAVADSPYSCYVTPHDRLTVDTTVVYNIYVENNLRSHSHTKEHGSLGIGGDDGDGGGHVVVGLTHFVCRRN